MSKLYWRRILIASVGILAVVFVIYLTWYKDGKIDTLPATITSPTIMPPLMPPDPSTGDGSGFRYGSLNKGGSR